MFYMKERRDARFEADQSLWITIFGEPDIQLPARVKNVSGRGIGLEMDGPVATGSALKIQLDDCLLLGEVIYCRRDASSYYIGVELEQALAGLAELGAAVRGFYEELAGEPASPPATPAGGKGRRRR
jgi:hypothetical protein